MPADIVGTSVSSIGPAAVASWRSSRGRSSTTSSSPTRSTAPRPRRSRRCSRRWPRARSPPPARRAAARAVPRPRHPEPARDGGHLSAARGPARRASSSRSTSRFPGERELLAILDRTTGTKSAAARPVLDGPTLLEMRRFVRSRPGRAQRRRVRRARAARPPTPTMSAPPISSSATSASAAARAAPRPCCWPPGSAASWTAASRRRSTTSGRRPLRAASPRDPQLRGRGRGRRHRQGHPSRCSPASSADADKSPELIAWPCGSAATAPSRSGPLPPPRLTICSARPSSPSSSCCR